MSLVMVAVRWRSQLAFRSSSGDAVSSRSFASVTGGVAIGALIMIIPLAMTLLHAYGVVEDPDSGRRTTMIILGAYLAVIGNGLPRMLPSMSSMQCDGARVQAFQRLAGWTWMLCGLGFATAWLALPSDAAEPCVDGTGCCGHDRDDRATPAPSQAAAARSGPELTTQPP
jgi:hypothetical protein